MIPIARYRFTAVMHQPVRLPDYAGSLLRGQFGSALRHLACMVRQPSCGGCTLVPTCPYTRVFEAPPPASHGLQAFSAIPNAYVVEPPWPTLGPGDGSHERQAGTSRVLQAGDTLTFHQVLIGDAQADLALVTLAWQRALAQGLTTTRSRAELAQVDLIDASEQAQPIWRAQAPTLLAHNATLTVPPRPPSSALRLDIHTPMRLQHQGHPLGPDRITLRPLVAAVARRAALMLEFHARQPEWGQRVPQVVAHSAALIDQRELRWYDWTRYSGRQKQEMTLGGVLGHWVLQGDGATLDALWPWLWLGQWLHVGKNATFGLGGYRLSAAQAT